MYITTTCPVRISLVGGSSDLESYLDVHKKGSVISFTPNLYTYISLYKDVLGKNNLENKYIINYSKREEVEDASLIQNDLIKIFFQEHGIKPCSVHMTSDVFSYGSGLATSSSYSCCLMKAISEMNGESLSDVECASKAHSTERKINPLVGFQDPFGCCKGGFKKIEFEKDKEPKYTILPSTLFNHYDICLYFTGITRSSTEVLKKVKIPIQDTFNPLVEQAEKCIMSEDYISLMKLIRDGWEEKKRTFDLIDKLKSTDEWIGSISAAHKLCGAGNGGFFLAFFDKGSRIPKGFHKVELSNYGLKTIISNTSYVRGITAGAFDIIHPGYCKLFKECKNHCNHLTVALHEDPSLERNKLKPVHTLEERYEILSSIKYVDDIIIYKSEKDLEEVLRSGNYQKRFLGSDYKNKDFTGKNLNIPVIFINRDHNYSTTNLKKLIYNSYG